MTETRAAIAITDVSVSYDKGRSMAVRGVSLAVHEGTFIALIGSSGSGKTTMLKVVNRLVEPMSGRVEISGEDVSRLDPALLRRRVGYVFQGVGLFPHLTVAENIAITPKLLGWDTGRRARRVTELLDLVHLPRDLAARLPATLSGGQAQRVGVARALAAEPKIVLMDEPFGAVDQITRTALARDYRELHERLGLTTVMVTHDVVEAVLIADRIAVLSGGQIVEEGSAHDLLSEAKHEYSRQLMSMPRLQAERINRLEGASPA
jgi:osmoprotectant transport system ATP-binding protein